MRDKKEVFKRMNEEAKKAEELKKAEEAKAAEEAKKAEELKKAEEAKKAEELKKAERKVTEEDLLKAIDNLEVFSKAQKKVDEEEKEKEKEEEEKALKSFSDNFEANETLEKAIEVSPFLEAIAGEVEVSVGAMGKEINKLSKSMEVFDGKHIDVLKSVAESIKGLTSKVEEMTKGFDERLKKIEETPVRGPKSVLKAAALEKGFTTGSEGENALATVPKRRIADALEKAVEDGKIKDTVLIAFESDPGYLLSGESAEIVKAYIK